MLDALAVVPEIQSLIFFHEKVTFPLVGCGVKSRLQSDIIYTETFNHLEKQDARAYKVTEKRCAL